MRTRYHLIVGTFYVFVTSFFFVRADLNSLMYEKGDILYFLISLALSLICLFLVNILLEYGKFRLNEMRLINLVLLPVYAFILFALPEEIIFRYVIQGILLGGSVHPFWVILLASVVYGFAHMLNGAGGMHPRVWNWRLVIMTTTLGVFLSALYHVTSSLLLPIILHGIYILIDQMFLSKKPVSIRI